MEDSILNYLTEQYDTLTRSDKKLANYIFDNKHEVQYLSISSLAQNAGVAEATITRFCRKIKLSGYNDLKIALAKEERSQRLDGYFDLQGEEQAEDEKDSIARNLCGSYIAAFQETLRQYSQETIRRAVDILIGAEHVYCFGQGESMVMAMEAWARFATVNQNFIHIQDSHLQMKAVGLMTPRDAILFFSYSGTTKELGDVMALTAERSIPLILITHFLNSSAAKKADVTLFCGYNESPLQAGSIAAKMGQLLLVDCLFHEYCSRSSETFEKAYMDALAAVSRRLL